MKIKWLSVLVVLSFVVMFLNILGGTIGGLWLILTGGVWLIITAVIASFVMPWIYSFALLPSTGLLALTAKLYEKQRVVLASILAFLGSFWEKSLVWFWMGLVFYYFISQVDHFNPFALILAAYATAMSPLQYMASHEKYASGEDSMGTTAELTYAILVFLIMTIAWLLAFSPVGLLWILTFLFAGVPAYMIIKSPKLTSKV